MEINSIYHRNTFHIFGGLEMLYIVRINKHTIYTDLSGGWWCICFKFSFFNRLIFGERNNRLTIRAKSTDSLSNLDLSSLAS